MQFANGTNKAGVFKENVLVELLMNDQPAKMIEEKLKVTLPEDFKQELAEYIEEMNPKEDKPFLNKELKKNQTEDLQQPNTLLKMQEMPNAPWGEGDAVSRGQYI